MGAQHMDYIMTNKSNMVIDVTFIIRLNIARNRHADGKHSSEVTGGQRG